MREHHVLAIQEKCELGHYLYNSAEPGLVSHIHDNALEICYLIKGRQSYRVGDREIQMKGGDYFVTLPNEPHDSAGKVQDRGELIWLILEIPLPKQGFLQLPQAESTALRKAIFSITTPYFRGDQDSSRLWKRLLLESRKTIDGDFMKMELRLHLLACLCNVLRCSLAKTTSIKDDLMMTCCQKIQSDPRHVPTLEELSSDCHLSLSRFKARFKDSIGMPPGEFINREKIEWSKHKLSSAKNFTDLAFELGFSSSQYFATVFKKYTRKTPSEWLLSQK